MKTSFDLIIGNVYSREELINYFQITDATVNTGVFRPKGYNSIWLFITEKKTPDRTQYIDFLNGNDLIWDGQTSGRTDHLIISHKMNNDELLVFYRREKDEFSHSAFRYEGPFIYISHSGNGPSHFNLKRDIQNQL
jgi:hypothetical protein